MVLFAGSIIAIVVLTALVTAAVLKRQDRQLAHTTPPPSGVPVQSKPDGVDAFASIPTSAPSVETPAHTRLNAFEQLALDDDSKLAQTNATLSPTELFAAASPAVVKISLFDWQGKDFALGSGFFVSSDGLLVTNYHVIKGAYTAIVLPVDGRAYEVQGIVAASPEADLAILQVKVTGAPFLEISNGPMPPVGTRVYAIGNPKGLTNTFTDGIVEAQRQEGIQHSAPISPGSSGGPLLTADKRVVGVNRMFKTDAQNLNFAVPAATLVELMAHRSVTPQPIAIAGGQRVGEIEVRLHAIEQRMPLAIKAVVDASINERDCLAAITQFDFELALLNREHTANVKREKDIYWNTIDNSPTATITSDKVAKLAAIRDKAIRDLDTKYNSEASRLNSAREMARKGAADSHAYEVTLRQEIELLTKEAANLKAALTDLTNP